MTTKQISQRTGIPWSTLVTWAKSDPAGWRYQLVMAMSVATPEFFSKFNVEQGSVEQRSGGLSKVEPKSGGVQSSASGLMGGLAAVRG